MDLSCSQGEDCFAVFLSKNLVFCQSVSQKVDEKAGVDNTTIKTHSNFSIQGQKQATMEEEFQQTSQETQQKTAPKCVPRFRNATLSALTHSTLRGPSVSHTLGEFLKQVSRVKYLLGVQKVVIDHPHLF